MDTRQLPVVVSGLYHDDLKNVFHYGVDTFGLAAAVNFIENIERIVNKLGFSVLYVSGMPVYCYKNKNVP